MEWTRNNNSTFHQIVWFFILWIVDFVGHCVHNKNTYFTTQKNIWTWKIDLSEGKFGFPISELKNIWRLLIQSKKIKFNTFDTFKQMCEQMQNVVTCHMWSLNVNYCGIPLSNSVLFKFFKTRQTDQIDMTKKDRTDSY